MANQTTSARTIRKIHPPRVIVIASLHARHRGWSLPRMIAGGGNQRQRNWQGGGRLPFEDEGDLDGGPILRDLPLLHVGFLLHQVNPRHASEGLVGPLEGRVYGILPAPGRGSDDLGNPRDGHGSTSSLGMRAWRALEVGRGRLSRGPTDQKNA